MTNPFPAPPSSVDVAIIGGGVSGMYTAYRLAASNEYKGAQIAVFDAESRFGGRINTLRLKIVPLIADVGAMRFLKSQVLVNSLVARFHLEESRYEYLFPTDSFCVRGRDLSPVSDEDKGQLLDLYYERRADSAPSPRPQDGYKRLARDEVGKEPARLIALGIAKVLSKLRLDRNIRKNEEIMSAIGDPEDLENRLALAAVRGDTICFDYFSPAEWTAIKRFGEFENNQLYKMGFWDLIQSQLSPEAFALVQDGIGYHSIMGTWSAAEALPWFLLDFSTPPDELRSLRGGMDRLVAKLQDGLAKQEDPVCFRKHELKSVEKGDGDSVRLTFEAWVYLEAGRPVVEKRVVEASKVVLAMGQVALSKVNLDNLPVSDEQRGAFRRSIASVTAHPLLKMFLFYRSPWWWDGLPTNCRSKAVGCVKTDKGHEFKGARILTDLPLRQIYYHGPKSDSRVSNGVNDDQRWSMIMAYCDERHADYWASLNAKDEQPYVSQALTQEINDLPDEDAKGVRATLADYGVPQVFAARAHEQTWRSHAHRVSLKLLQHTDIISADGVLTGEIIPKSETVLYMDWRRPPFYGGWHTWNIGVESWAVRERICRPFDGINLFICGEAFSSDQGWVEGALRSAERILTQQLRLNPPSWLQENRLKSLGYRDFAEYVMW